MPGFFSRRSLPALAALFAGLPALASAGTGGAPSDRLDWPGTPTDRYLDAGEVRAVLHGASDGFFACFRQHASMGAGGGEVGVGFTIGQDGRATAIAPEIAQAAPALGECIAAVVAAMSFGEHDGDPFEVSYPLVYEVDARGARILPYPIVFYRPRQVRLPLLELPADSSPGEVRMLELILTDETSASTGTGSSASAVGSPAPASPDATDAPPEPAEQPGPAGAGSGQGGRAPAR